MIRAASLSIDVNLLSLSQLLQRQGVPHRIVEESGQQVIWVEGEGEAALVRQALADWSSNSGNLQADPLLRNAGTVGLGTALLPRRSPLPALKHAFVASPVTFSLIAACLLVALLSLMGSQPGRVGVLFYPLLAVDNVFALLGELTSIGTLLRTLTPEALRDILYKLLTKGAKHDPPEPTPETHESTDLRHDPPTPAAKAHPKTGPPAKQPLWGARPAAAPVAY